MLRKQLLASLLALSFVTAPALIGCDRKVSDEKTVKTNPDTGKKTVDEKKTVETPEGGTKTTEEHKTVRP